VTLPPLSTAACPLGAPLVLAAECTWTPTGERVRLPALATSALQVSLAWVAPPAVALGYTALPLGLAATIGAAATSSGASAATEASCEVLLVNASVHSARLASDAWSLALDGSAPNGTSVPTAVNVTGQAPPTTQLHVKVACTVWGQTISTPPLRLTTASLETRLRSALPATFIASDASAPWPLEPQLMAAVVARNNEAVVGDVTCSVTATTPATDLVAMGASLRSIAADAYTGVVVVPRFVVQTLTTTPNITLLVECQHLASGDAVLPLSLTVPATLLTVQPCTAPVSKAAVGDPLPAFSVGVAATAPGGTTTSPCAASSGTTHQPVVALPPIVCGIGLDASTTTINDTSAVFLQHTIAVMAADSHMTTFDKFTMVVPQGQRYGLLLACVVGGLNILPMLSFSVEIEGCRAGQASESVTCVTCGGGDFSLGGKGAQCIRCPPAGAVCNEGILTLLPNYFRPAAQAGEPLGPNTELHPCYNSEACTLVFSGNSSGATYGCATGYTGPLCGVCDAAANYARFGDACSICWDPGASVFFLAVVLTIVLALLTHMALFSEVYNKYPDDAIVLRIAMSYLQGVGSLRVFIAGSTQAYASVMGWTEVVSASPLSVGALQCIMRLPYLTQYAGTVLLPVLASALVIIIFLVGTTARSVRCTSTRRPVSPPLIAPPGNDAAPMPRPVATSAATNSSGGGCCSLDTAALKGKLASWWSSKRHISTMLFVLFLTYMPITSASLRVLDCIDPVAGIRYLRSNLAVECGVGQHAVATVLAYSVLVAVGIGFPAGLAWLLGTARKEQLLETGFHATWGFLFDGYRAPTRKLVSMGGVGPGSAAAVSGERDKDKVAKTPPIVAAPLSGGRSFRMRRRSSLMPDRLMQTWVVDGDSRVWWEGVVLARKAGVVLLAVLVTNPYMQCVGATLWFFGAILLQLKYTPYEQTKFNRLELATLTATFVTAVVSTALLQYNVDVATADLHPPADMTPIEWTVTIALVVINMGMFATLGFLWLRVQWGRARTLWRALPGRRKTPVALPPLTSPAASVGDPAPGSLGSSSHGGDDGADGGVALVTLNPLRTGSWPVPPQNPTNTSASSAFRLINSNPATAAAVGGDVTESDSSGVPGDDAPADRLFTVVTRVSSAPLPATSRVATANPHTPVVAMPPVAVRVRLATKHGLPPPGASVA